jgi:hypothetical protein
MSESEPLPIGSYADEANTIRGLAAQAKSAEVREQLLRIAALYEKLAMLLRDAALHSLVTMASTLQGDLDARQGDLNARRTSYEEQPHRVEEE